MPKSIKTTGDIIAFDIPTHQESIQPGKSRLYQAEYPLSPYEKGILEDTPAQCKVLGIRSGLAQVGIDGVMNELDVEGHKATANVTLTNYGDPAWLDRVSSINPEIGRIIVLPENHLSEGEVHDSISQGLVKIGSEYKVDPDGTLKIKVSPVRYLLSQNLFKLKPENYDSVLKHGRRALDSNLQAFEYLDSLPKLQSGDFFVGGISFSTIGFSAMIDRQQHSDLIHLAAYYLDPLRSTGLSKRLGRAGHRQIELANLGNEELDLNETWISLKLYPPASAVRSKIESVLQGASKNRVHDEGILMAETMGLTSFNTRERLFDQQNKSDSYGLILTKDGVSKIPSEANPDLQLGVTEAILDNEPNDVQGLEDICKTISKTRDQGSLLVCTDLPDNKSLIRLSDSGIRGYLFRAENQHLTAADHLAMIEVAKKYGAEFYYHVGGQFRVFFNESWVKIDDIDRMKKVTFPVAIYGSAVKGTDHLLRRDLAEFVKMMKSHFKDEFALVHGNGSGVMLLADHLARENGVVSIGIGADFEFKGEKQNFDADSVVSFSSKDRIHRQTVLERLAGARLYNIGGAGTLEEIALALCNTKLGATYPAPLILVDPSGDKDHIWQGVANQINVLSGKETFNFDNKLITLDSPVLQPWLRNVVHVVRSYTQAADILINFGQSPQIYWNNAGIPDTHIQRSIKNKVDSSPYSIPSFLKSA